MLDRPSYFESAGRATIGNLLQFGGSINSHLSYNLYN